MTTLDDVTDDLARGLDADLARGLVDFARSPAAPPWPRTTILELIELRAAESGDRPAISEAGSAVSYASLVERSRAVAAALTHAGVVRGDRVGVHVGRSTELVVAALGVFACGAVYVPLDPAQPDERLRLIVDDAELVGVISTDDGPSRPFAAHVWTLDELERVRPLQKLVRASPDDPAYVIYTSGSTGRPKGVAVRHGSVVALVDATAPLLRFGDEDVWTWLHSPGFDFSIWEIFGCLATGGRLVVVPYWTARSPRALHTLLAEERVTILSATPTAFAELVTVQERRAGLDVRLVVLGGEQVQPSAVARWKQRLPDDRCAVVNMYGITETTVHVTAHCIERSDAERGDSSIGRPLPGWEVYVVGKDEFARSGRRDWRTVGRGARRRSWIRQP